MAGFWTDSIKKSDREYMNQEMHFLSNFGKRGTKRAWTSFHGLRFESDPLAEAWDTSRLWRAARDVHAGHLHQPFPSLPNFSWHLGEVEGIQVPLFRDSGPNENS